MDTSRSPSAKRQPRRIARFSELATATILDALMSIAARPLRSAAMMLGVLLGVASGTASVIIADTQQVRIDRQFDAQRSASIVMQTEMGREPFDADALSRIEALSVVSAAGELSVWQSSASVRSHRYAEAEGVPLVAASSGGLEVADCRITGASPEFALGGDKPIAYLGGDLAQRWGVTNAHAEAVIIDTTAVSVAGIADCGDGYAYLNSAVILGPRLARARFDSGENVRAVAAIRPGAASAVAEFAIATLDPTGERSLRDVTPPDGELLRSNVADDMRRVGLAFAGFIGLLGMVSVANTLNLSVQQRWRELGLRSALGWTARRIGMLIVLESAIAGCIASAVGVALGTSLAAAWCAWSGWPLTYWPPLGGVAIALGVGSSALGALAPAWRAASVSPLTALRS